MQRTTGGSHQMIGGIWLASAALASMIACSSGQTAAPATSTSSTGSTPSATKDNTTSTSTQTTTTKPSITDTTSTTSTTTPTTTGSTGTNTTTATSTTTLVSGYVTRNSSAQVTGTGTLCIAITNACLSNASLSTFKGYRYLEGKSVDLSSTTKQVTFAFNVPNTGTGTLPAGQYSIIAYLREDNGTCATNNFIKGDPFTWQDPGVTSPCPTFTFKVGTTVTNQAVTLNANIPFSYTIPSQ